MVAKDKRSGCRRVAEMTLVGVMLLAVSAPLVAFSVKARVPVGEVISWVGLIATTVLVCGYATRQNPERRTKPRFWGLLVLFAVVQIAIGAKVLSTGVRVRAAVWPAVFFADALALNIVIAWAVSPERKANDVAPSDHDVAASA